ncbi:MAG: hypothetical protein JNK77_16065 [Saprospiraceae bacterium]|nr:hypothetical protein [Saprospiraceae bacterium]
MTQTVHRIYVTTLASIVVLAAIIFVYQGFSYYGTSLEERFYHPQHDWFKPSGIYGHGLGIVGSLLIIIGVFSYIIRKRSKAMARWGRLKYWLEFHIFLCSLGPLMILFHTAFKFGGIVSVSFWSMVAVVASGIIGRFIYIQIPRTIEGRELSLGEVKAMKGNIGDLLKGSFQLDQESYNAIIDSTTDKNHQEKGNNVLAGIVYKYVADRKTIADIDNRLRKNNLPRSDRKKVLNLIKNEMALNNRIARLQTMQNLFRYWHVAHLPFALIMLIIMIIHVGITLAFGYRWIF